MKIIVLTNALLVHKPDVMQALSALRAGPYEIWAKLDGGTQSYFEKMAGRNVSLKRIVENAFVGPATRITVSPASAALAPFRASRREMF
jgi:hypothetical protein